MKAIGRQAILYIPVKNVNGYNFCGRVFGNVYQKKNVCVCAGIGCALRQWVGFCVCVCAGTGCALSHSKLCVCVCVCVCADIGRALIHTEMCVSLSVLI